MESYIPFLHHLKKIALCYKRTGSIPTYRKEFEPVECCGTVFKYQSHLKRHHIKHCKLLKREPFKCGMCPESFASIEALQIHKSEIHNFSGEKWHCMLCNKSFATNGNLTSHMAAIHIKGKMYECNKCQFSYPRKDCFIRHYKTMHERIKTFKCDICKRMFKRKDALTQHMNIHLEGRIPCIVCSLSFTCVELFKRHTSVHRPCQICGLTFKLRRDRDNHMKWHLQGNRRTKQRVIKRNKSDVKGVKDQNQGVSASLKEIHQNS